MDGMLRQYLIAPKKIRGNRDVISADNVADLKGGKNLDGIMHKKLTQPDNSILNKIPKHETTFSAAGLANATIPL